MPDVTITQRFIQEDGNSLPTGQSNLYFIAEGSDDYADVEAAFDQIPSEYRGLPRRDVLRDHAGANLWYLTAQYSAVEQPQEPLVLGDPPRIEFDTTGGQRTLITHADIRNGYPGPGLSTVPDYGGAINVVDGVPQGLEIETGGATMTISQVISAAQASNAYRRLLMIRARRVVNAAPFGPFNAYECRFMGARFSSRADGNVDLVRVFEGAENVVGGSYAGVTGVEKRGHEYVWAPVERQADTAAKVMVPRVLGVLVHEIYPAVDFAELDP